MRPVSSAVLAIVVFWSLSTQGGVVPANPAPVRPLADCGSLYEAPFGSKSDAGPRYCPPSTARTYKRQYSGIGYEILDSESEACFVPDEIYSDLDQIVEKAKHDIIFNADLTQPDARLQQARTISAAIGRLLVDRGFALYIPTDNLGDALVRRNLQSERERHVFDCDTSSFIYLTVAENTSLPLSLVEIKLPSCAGHNYIRWNLGGTLMDWDTNGRAECKTPSNLPTFQGKAMTRAQTLGYARALRAELWKTQKAWDKALADFRFTTTSYPESPLGWNNLAWLVATRPVSDRMKVAVEAKAAALRAVSISRTANFLDTLACTFALIGDFGQAEQTERDALTLEPTNSEFEGRLKLFKGPQPHDCTGID